MTKDAENLAELARIEAMLTKGFAALREVHEQIQVTSNPFARAHLQRAADKFAMQTAELMAHAMILRAAIQRDPPAAGEVRH